MTCCVDENAPVARTVTRGLLAAAIFSLGACGGSGNKLATASSNIDAHAQSSERSQRSVQEAVALLQAGDSVTARGKLLEALAQHPNYPVALKLLKQIDTDPKALLGTSSVPYTVKAGENFNSLARKHLGDSMMFYALARYNDVQTPTALSPGQVIRIPQRKRRVERPQASKPEPAASKSPRPAEKASARAPGREKSGAKPPSDPALAARLRGSALKAMNSGAIDRAIVLLRQAQKADPGNTLVSNDLARALRIKGTLGGGR